MGVQDLPFSQPLDAVTIDHVDPRPDAPDSTFRPSTDAFGAVIAVGKTVILLHPL